MAFIKGTDKRQSADYYDRKRSRSIDDFKAILSKGSGMARTAHYEVVLTPPAAMVEKLRTGEFAVDLSNYTRDISLLCNAIMMPGHDLNTTTIKFGSAPAREMVTAHAYEGTITSSFYMDENLETKSYFELWQNMAVSNKTHKVGYYDTYVGTMRIYQLGGGGRTYGIEVEEVYPETIGGIEYAYETVDTLALLPVEFQYRKWKTIDPRDVHYAFEPGPHFWPSRKSSWGTSRGKAFPQ